MTTLVNDLSIICGDEQWHTVLGVSITCIAVYVVGIMSFLCYIISVAPMHFHEPTFRKRWNGEVWATPRTACRVGGDVRHTYFFSRVSFLSFLG